MQDAREALCPGVDRGADRLAQETRSFIRLINGVSSDRGWIPQDTPNTLSFSELVTHSAKELVDLIEARSCATERSQQRARQMLPVDGEVGTERYHGLNPREVDVHIIYLRMQTGQ